MSIINHDVDLVLLDIIIESGDLITLSKLRLVNYYFYNYIKLITKTSKKLKLLFFIKARLKKRGKYYKSIVSLMVNDVLKNEYPEFKIDLLSTYDYPFIVYKQVITSENGYFMNTLRKMGDLISNFIIMGKNIKKVELIISGEVVAHEFYLNASLVSFIPFAQGLFISNLVYSDIDLRIMADEVNKLYSTHYYFPMKTVRDLQSKSMMNNHCIYSNGFYKSDYMIADGAGCFRYNRDTRK